jgi:hypothetical protein
MGAAYPNSDLFILHQQLKVFLIVLLLFHLNCFQLTVKDSTERDNLHQP